MTCNLCARKHKTAGRASVLGHFTWQRPGNGARRHTYLGGWTAGAECSAHPLCFPHILPDFFADVRYTYARRVRVAFTPLV
jgi:hypothetical protein